MNGLSVYRILEMFHHNDHISEFSYSCKLVNVPIALYTVKLKKCLALTEEFHFSEGVNFHIHKFIISWCYSSSSGFSFVSFESFLSCICSNIILLRHKNMANLLWYLDQHLPLLEDVIIKLTASVVGKVKPSSSVSGRCYDTDFFRWWKNSK